MVLDNKLGIMDSIESARKEDKIEYRKIYRKGIVHSYYYEGYTEYKTGYCTDPI